MDTIYTAGDALRATTTQGDTQKKSMEEGSDKQTDSKDTAERLKADRQIDRQTDI